MPNTSFLLPVVPRIQTLKDLSNQVRLSKGLLYKLVKKTDSFYNVVTIPKKNGGHRELACPSKELKAVQAWILTYILNNISVHPSASAYIRGKSLIDNVEPHKNNKNLLIMDIENFFGTIPYGNVWNIFHSLGYNSHVSHMLTSLCTFQGHLPQGGVTSPALSNIICIKLDRRIFGLASRFNLAYTRYADDITLSGNRTNIWPHIKAIVSEIIHDEGFAVNESKTRILGQGSRKQVTGLVIPEDEKHAIGIGRKKYRELRVLMLNTILPLGDDKNKQEHDKAKLNGWLAYLQGVDPARFFYLKQYELKLKDWKIEKEAAAAFEEISRYLPKLSKRIRLKKY